MRAHVVTLFREFFSSPLDTSILGRAQRNGALEVVFHDPRDHTTDKHRSADDEPFGGGGGMVMKVGPIAGCLADIRASDPSTHIVLMTPAGAPMKQATAERLASRDSIALVCGHYEGVDDRVRNLVNEEISLGDYVLTGGETATLVVLDAVCRLLPGVLGNAESAVHESHTGGVLLEHPQYTRPREFEGLEVPPVLLSGHHERVAQWRRSAALHRTAERRPDLFALHELSEHDRKLMEQFPGAGRGPKC